MNIFKKKMILIANVFRKLLTPKNVIRSMSKKSRLRRSFKKQHKKRCTNIVEIWAAASLPYLLINMKVIIYKKSLLVIWKIFRLFSNTLSAHGKYSLVNKDNLTRLIQMQLSPKQKNFSSFSSTFLKSTLNFEFREKKMTLISEIFPKLPTSENVVR